MNGFIKKIIFYVIILSLFVLSSAKEEKVIYLLPEEYKETTRDLEIVFIDVGQGDCALVITPNKKIVLIDAGGLPYWMENVSWDPGENIVVPYLTERNINCIDIVIVTHPHGDHFGGMFAVLDSLNVKNFIDNGYTEGDPNYVDILNVVDKKNIPYDQFKEGDVLELDKNIIIKVLFPPKNGFPFEGTNNSSIVFKLIYENFTALFTGDIESDVENYLCSKYKNELKSILLKVPHHGSRTSSTSRFINYVSPEVAIISCGRKNMFGHPHNEVVARYIKRKVELYRTDENGNVKVITDGKYYTVMPTKY